MKKLILCIGLVLLLVFTAFGCGVSKAAKVAELNNYLAQEEKVGNKFADDFTALSLKMSSSKTPEEVANSFAEGKAISDKAVTDLKALKTPAEMKEYKDKEIEIINALGTSFGKMEEATKKQDAQALLAEAQNMEKLGTEITDGKVLDDILKKVAKDNGINVDIQGDKYKFKL